MPAAVIDIAIRARNEASAALVQTSQQVETLGQKTRGSEIALRSATNSLGQFGHALTNILILSSLLPGNVGRGVNQMLLLATSTINAVYAITQLVQIYKVLAESQKVQIVLQSILHGLSGVGLARVGLAVAVGAAAYAGTTALIDQASKAPAPVTIINNGVLMGNEADARSLARRVQEINREDTRLAR